MIMSMKAGLELEQIRNANADEIETGTAWMVNECRAGTGSRLMLEHISPPIPEHEQQNWNWSLFRQKRNRNS